MSRWAHDRKTEITYLVQQTYYYACVYSVGTFKRGLVDYYVILYSYGTNAS